MIYDFTTTLTEKKQLTGDVFLFIFTLNRDQKLEFTPGQYLLLKIGEAYRQYSIASSSTIHDRFELIVKIIPNGLASNYLNGLSVGGRAFFRGPAGVFILKSVSAPKVFLATGTGIAPMLSMLHTAFTKIEKPTGIDAVKGRLIDLSDPYKTPPAYQLFWGLKTCDDIFYKDNLRDIKNKNEQFDFAICLSREKSIPDPIADICRLGRMNDAVVSYILKHKDILDQIEWYLCGGKEIVDSLKALVTSQGVSSPKIFFEKYF